MNNCPKCGNEINAQERYCSSCGAEVHQNEGAGQHVADVVKSKPASKRRKLAIILSSIAALVAVGVVSGLLFYKFTPPDTLKKHENMASHAEDDQEQIITPASLSLTKLPDEKIVQVLVAPNGKVYLNLTGTRDTSVLSSEKFREEVLKTAYNYYRESHPDARPLTASEVEEFSKIGTFGVPMNKLPQWLDMSTDQRDEFMKTAGGIPVALPILDGPRNEFQMWLLAIKNVMHSYDLHRDLFMGQSITIKAGQDSPFRNVRMVMDNLQIERLNKFTLMTSLKAEREEE